MSDSETYAKPPVIFGPLTRDLPFMVRNLNAMLRPVGATVRESLGLETGSIGILSLIWVNPGISQNDLAENLTMKKSVIAKQVKRLEAEGLLERRRVTGDRRVNAITLTSDGHQMMARIRRLTTALNDNIMRDVPAEDREAFFRVLEKLHGSLAIDLREESAPRLD